jgi:hypothetical protein
MMANKPKKPTAVTEKYPRKIITCQSGPSIDEQGRSFARLITSPELAAHRVIGMMQPKVLADEIDTPTLLATLRDQAAAVQSGDLAHAEAMLINQASSLQALFVRLAERAMEQNQMPNLEGFMRMALRAQSQCRATLETLATIKNPPIVYAKQANVTSGPQQINNGFPPSHAREKEIPPIKLLESNHGERLDTGTAQAAGGANQAMAAMEPVNGAKVGGREKGRESKRIQGRHSPGA